MDPAVAAALIGGVAQGGTAIAQGKMNRATRQFAQEQAAVTNQRNIENYKMMMQDQKLLTEEERKYNEGLRDNERGYGQQIWEQENQYNSPAEQMKRYKAAGLNANLIYGQSNMGGSIGSPDTNASPTKQASVAGAPTADWNPKAINFDNLAQLGNDYISNRQTQAQTDLVKENIKTAAKQQQLMELDGALKTLGIAAELKDFKAKRELTATSVEAAKAGVKNLTAQTNSLNQQSRFAAELHPGNLKQQVAQLAIMEGTKLNQEQQQKLMQLDEQLKRLELTWGKGFLNVPEMAGRIWEGLKGHANDKIYGGDPTWEKRGNTYYKKD